MEKWIPGYRVQGHEEKVVGGTKNLYLVTGGDDCITQRSYLWDGGNTVSIEVTGMGMVFEEETVGFTTPAEAKAYIVGKMKRLRGFYDHYDLRVDISEQWRIERGKHVDAAAAQGAASA